MLKVQIELYPFGDSKRRSKIDTVYIANRGRLPMETQNHRPPEDVCRYEVWRGANPNVKKRKGEGGVVVHRRKDGALKLVARALDALAD